MKEIRCPNCKKNIKIDEVLINQLEDSLITDLTKKHEEELADVKSQAENEIKLSLSREYSKAQKETELLIKKLELDAKDEKEQNKKLMSQLEELNTSLRNTLREKDQIKIAADKKVLESENQIRQEVKTLVDEEYRLKLKEQEKKLNDMEKALVVARRKAMQGSEQLQGEVLELELESLLKREFSLDEINEIKKGVKGADIIQIVKNKHLEKCGIILYESKNAAWSTLWLSKFKNDIRTANANIGILVSRQMPNNEDMMCMNGVWVVKPKLVLPLATAIRNQILAVYTANNNAQNKDIKMENLYQFLIGAEFKHRIEAIIENYTLLQSEMEKERRLAEIRWSKQEKSIRAVIDNTLGMYGDLQGITGDSLGQLKQLETKEEITS